MTSPPAGARVRVGRYSRVHLRPGDQFTLGGLRHELTGRVGPHLRVTVLGAQGLAGPGSPARSDTVDIDDLPDQIDVVPGPGRTSGLLQGFWHGRVQLPPAPERLDENTLALTTAGAVRLCFGSRTRHTSHGRGGLTWLAVTGAGIALGEYNPHRACWSELVSNLEVAAALDGGLNAAGAAAVGYLRRLPDTLPPWWEVPKGLWHTALLTHLRLPADAATTLAMLAGEWDGTLNDLAPLIVMLTEPPAPAASAS